MAAETGSKSLWMSVAGWIYELSRSSSLTQTTISNIWKRTRNPRFLRFVRFAADSASSYSRYCALLTYDSVGCKASVCSFCTEDADVLTAVVRAEKKMSQGELLSQIQLMGIDMNQAKLSRIEGKRIAIPDRDLIVIAKCLGVTLDELCKQDNDTKANSLRLDDYLLHLLSILPERAERNKDFEVDDLLPWSEEMKLWFSAV